MKLTDLKLAKKRAIVKRYRDGAPLADVARAQGVSQYMVRRVLKEMGAETRSRGAPEKRIDREQLRAEYESGKTVGELAEAHDASRSTILTRLHEAGAAMRHGRPSKK